MCLAAAGTREYGECICDGGNCSELGFIEIGEKNVRVHGGEVKNLWSSCDCNLGKWK